LLDYRQVNIQL